MRIDELQAREDVEDVLRTTMQEGWSEQFRRPIRIDPPGYGPGQLWLLQPLLSVAHAPNVTRPARRFIADGFRFTQRRSRSLPQWLLGTLLASRPGLRGLSRAVFRANPPIPRAGDLVIVPGNQRVRVFDLGARVSRVLLKSGFDRAAILTEVAVRGDGRTGPFIPITTYDPEGRWFEEPFVDGLPMSRCPPWWDRKGIEDDAIRLLMSWLDATETTEPAAEHIDHLVHKIERRIAILSQGHGPHRDVPFRQWIEVLSDLGARAHTVKVCRSHGDFQPGNVLVDRLSGKVFLTDWEYSTRRVRSYDLLVYALDLRFPQGLAVRLQAYVAHGKVAREVTRGNLAFSRTGRANEVALVLLEELDRQLIECTSGVYRALPRSFLQFADALASLGNELEALFPRAVAPR